MGRAGRHAIERTACTGHHLQPESETRCIRKLFKYIAHDATPRYRRFHGLSIAETTSCMRRWVENGDIYR